MRTIEWRFVGVLVVFWAIGCGAQTSSGGNPSPGGSGSSGSGGAASSGGAGQLGELAGGCETTSDCRQPLVCAFQRCHSECTRSRDCQVGERCVPFMKPYNACQLPSERNCVRNADCPADQTCAADGRCRAPCASTQDCIQDQTCEAGGCADPGEIDGGVPAADGGG